MDKQYNVKNRDSDEDERRETETQRERWAQVHDVKCTMQSFGPNFIVFNIMLNTNITPFSTITFHCRDKYITNYLSIFNS